MDGLVHLARAQVLEIHAAVIAADGGSPGLRDEALLESAIAAPQATFGGESVFSDPIEIAAAYLFYLCRNHPFVDGNKRVAFVSSLLFLKLNGFATAPDGPEWEALVLDVAASRIDRDATTARLRALVRPPRRRKPRAAPRDR
ncbi:MAG: type II toxin-antitoxin system death-on-curing family toxin [Alphaproteobacteria bacterium]